MNHMSKLCHSPDLLNQIWLGLSNSIKQWWKQITNIYLEPFIGQCHLVTLQSTNVCWCSYTSLLKWCKKDIISVCQHMSSCNWLNSRYIYSLATFWHETHEFLLSCGECACHISIQTGLVRYIENTAMKNMRQSKQQALI